MGRIEEYEQIRLLTFASPSGERPFPFFLTDSKIKFHWLLDVMMEMRLE